MNRVADEQLHCASPKLHPACVFNHFIIATSGEQLEEVIENTGRMEFWRSTGQKNHLVPAIQPQFCACVSERQGTPFQFTLVGGALPPGLSLTASGKLSGPLTTLGTYHFPITTTDLSSGCLGSRQLVFSHG